MTDQEAVVAWFKAWSRLESRLAAGPNEQQAHDSDPVFVPAASAGPALRPAGHQAALRGRLDGLTRGSGLLLGRQTREAQEIAGSCWHTGPSRFFFLTRVRKGLEHNLYKCLRCDITGQ